MEKKKFQVLVTNSQIVCKGRPDFLNCTKKNLRVREKQDRRHILHWATIRDILLVTFNRVFQARGNTELVTMLDSFLKRFREVGIRFRLAAKATLVKKVEKILAIACSMERNLVVGSAVANQGIENARSAIHKVRKDLNQYCLHEIRSFAEIQIEVGRLIADKLKDKSSGKVARYGGRILKRLARAVRKVTEVIDLVRLLADFEFSCTLDIIHKGTSPQQNIWGLTMYNRLQRAIWDRDDTTICDILL